MPAPDLTRARARVEQLMTDTCRVTRDPQGTDDDTLDTGTLTLTPPAGDTITVYQGPCSLTARGPSGRTNYGVDDDGGAAQWVGPYTLRLPFAAPVPAGGDTVEILTSQDPGLVGLSLVVRGAVMGTYKTSRQVECELRGA